MTETDKGDKSVSSIKKGCLVYPSLNEVNYTAFGEVTEEYHDELWSMIEYNNWMQEYKNGKPKMKYKRLRINGEIKEEERVLSHYIRDVMHHPENTNNKKYTYDELAKSISDMRCFIADKKNIEL